MKREKNKKTKEQKQGNKKTKEQKGKQTNMLIELLKLRDNCLKHTDVNKDIALHCAMFWNQLMFPQI